MKLIALTLALAATSASAAPFISTSPTCPLPDVFKGYDAASWCESKGYKKEVGVPLEVSCDVDAKKAGDTTTRFIIHYERAYCAKSKSNVKFFPQGETCKPRACDRIKELYPVKS